MGTEVFNLPSLILVPPFFFHRYEIPLAPESFPYPILLHSPNLSKTFYLLPKLILTTYSPEDLTDTSGRQPLNDTG